MRPDERDIDALLEAVAGGERPDWEGSEARAAGGPNERRVRALHDLARVAEFHRSLQQGADGPGAGITGDRWGELLLLEPVGGGADGDVYRAWDPALRREVALKLARTGEDASAMLAEARALARVRDPHVVGVHGAAEHDGRAGFWMEYLRGPTLASELERRGALPAAVVATLGAQLCRALAAAHAAGVLHRDVKPANVIREADDRWVLVDFGLGQSAKAPPALSRPYSGTPFFMSPQRLGGAAATAADDLYALGVTLRWALAGRAPFAAGTLDELRAEAARGPATPLAVACATAPATLVAAIGRLMAPDATDRFASAALAQAAFEAPLPAVTSAPDGAGAVLRRSRAAIALGGGALIAAALALALWMGRPHPSGPAAPPGTPPAAPATAYDVSASLVRSGGTGEDVLENGDRVAPGQQLELEFQATARTWVYVLEADERGESYLLFPQPLFDRANPLPADSTVRLPGTRAGRRSGWVVTSRGGREHFLIVASPAPVPELEAERATLPAPALDRPVRYARIDGARIERLRGVGGVSDLPARSAPADDAGVFSRFRALAGLERRVHGTWVRQVTLSNPAR